MTAALFLAAICGQLPTPQAPAAAVPAMGPPQTLVLLQYAPAAVPTAPSILVANPPLWDRMLHRTGQWLVDRAARHQHHQALTPVTVVTPAAQAAPAMLYPTAPAATPSASPQGTVMPPAPSPAMILIPDPPSADSLSRRLFGVR